MPVSRVHINVKNGIGFTFSTIKSKRALTIGRGYRSQKRIVRTSLTKIVLNALEFIV
jgi:predicted transporter